jgi:hypothetical protein
LDRCFRLKIECREREPVVRKRREVKAVSVTKLPQLFQYSGKLTEPGQTSWPIGTKVG